MPFNELGAPILFDRGPFKAGHNLQDNPALGLDNLAKVVQELPEDQVFFSSGLVPKDADFDRAHVDYRTGLSLKDTVENMMTSNSYIMVRAPEQHPSLRETYRWLLGDVEQRMKAQGVGARAVDPMLYLFIASPNSITPFHIDRYSTLLMQFRGTKDVLVYPAWDEEILKPADMESFVVKRGGKIPYREDFDRRATNFHFAPGEMIHIPFVAPHLVKNGPGEVSISMSIIFNTEETARHLRTLQVNHKLRSTLGRFGYSPRPPNQISVLDKAKSAALKAKMLLRP